MSDHRHGWNSRALRYGKPKKGYADESQPSTSAAIFVSERARLRSLFHSELCQLLIAEDFKPLLPSFAEAEMPPSRELPQVAERVVLWAGQRIKPGR
jgi:hypothetical protein